MKDHLQNIVATASGNLLKVSVAREYLQARALQALQDDGAFVRWAFVGGTALRFLYSIPRYSEDLDFSVLEPSAEAGFAAALRRVRAAFEAEAYKVSVTANEKRTVASGFVKFPGLLYELGLSPHLSQVLSIKIEVDTNPPRGAVTATTLVRKHVAINLVHHDKSSLLAGKLHAVLSRPWVKGRDIYDIVWYLADRSWPEPNLELLNSALTQTQWKGPVLTGACWRGVLADKLRSIDWNAARSDVFPFLERPGDIDLVSIDRALGLLEA